MPGSAASAAMVVSAPSRSPPSGSASIPAGASMSRSGPRETPLRRRSLRSVPPARYSGGLMAVDMGGSFQQRQQAVGADGDFLRADADGVADGIGDGGRRRHSGDFAD